MPKADRRSLITDLVEYRRALDTIVRDLDEVPAIAGADAGVLTRDQVLAMLDRVDRGNIEFSDLVAWAKEVEFVEDLAYESAWESDIAGVVSEMATPETDNRSEARRRSDWRRQMKG